MMRGTCWLMGAAVLASAMSASPAEADAGDRPTARLEYVRGRAAELCPSEDELRSAVAGRLGYDPFTPAAKRVVRVRIVGATSELRASVALEEADGAKRQRAPIVSRGLDPELSTVSDGGGAPARPPGSIAPILRSVGLALAGAAVGAVVHALAAGPAEVRYVDRIVAAEAAAPPPSPPSSVPLETAASGETAIAASASATPPRAPALSGDEVLAHERTLVDTARAAVIRGDGPAALAALQKHARTFPGGQLAEERDALLVRALVLSGQDDEARASALKFKRKYPASVFVPVVDAALTRKR